MLMFLTMAMNKNKKQNRGFTLIELLVVVSIVALLASIVMTALNSARQKGRDAKRLSDLHQLQLALSLYYTNNGQYPIELCVPEPYSTPVPAEGWAGDYPDYATCQEDFQTKMLPYISQFVTDPINDYKRDGYYAYWYGTIKGGQGYLLVDYLESGKIGEGCYNPENGWYCQGENWR